ncbi:MAG: allophanate hydrolase [Pseudomonadota bacterium]
MNLSIPALHAAYRRGEVTPQQVVEYILQRSRETRTHNIWINRLEPAQLQPYLDRLQDHTPDTLPLYGIPFAIKDNIDLAGVPTTAACAAFAYVPQQSAFVVQRLLDAGAIPIGKTNMDQFATGLVGTRSPAPWGECRNAFDPDYISGGSSSGSAVAVALGLVSFALGTDTAGSGRVPAAFNNIVGLKPSKGLLSMRGVVPACRSLDCVSIFALDCDDANAVLEQAAVFDGADDYARPNPFNNNQRHYGASPTRFRFAVPRQDQLEFFGNDASAALFAAACAALERLGGERIEIDFAPFLAAARLLYEGPWVAERYAAIEPLIDSRPEALLPVIREIIGGAGDKRAVEAFKAGYRLQNCKRQTDRVFEQIDILVTPTAGTLYTIDEINADPVRLNSHLGYYTNYMNLLDYSALALPAGFLANGLPFGITLVAPAMRDRLLLSFGRRWQQHLDLPLGKTQQHYRPAPLNAPRTDQSCIDVVVCGAHLAGFPLNWQLTERGAALVESTRTADRYRLYALAGGPPQRPALVRDENHGAAIAVEVWRVPAAQFGGFVADIPAPLGIGKVELADGRWLSGFICESCGVMQATEITEYGGWANYLRRDSRL